jgi:hypothetical protein
MKDSIWYPDLHIVGAPRCGTSALSNYLGNHPQVDFSKPKEPHYFATDFPALRYITDPNGYDRLFFGRLQPPAIRAEGSVWYLYSREAVRNILAATPRAKLIVMLRNPIEVCQSLHAHHVLARYDDEPDFSKALALANQRRSGEGIPKRCPAPGLIVYTDICRFGAQVARLLDAVPREQVHFILFEDFVADTAAAYRDILAFAGLPDDGRTDFSKANASAVVKSSLVNRLDSSTRQLRTKIAQPIKHALGIDGIGLWRLLEKHARQTAERTAMAPQVWQMLAETFADDVADLSRLLGRDLSHWLAPAAGDTAGQGDRQRATA